MLVHGARALGHRRGWIAIFFTVLWTGLFAGVAAGCWLGASAVYQHFGSRTIGVCVATDFAYREVKPDWHANLPSLFAEVNRLFQGTDVKWNAWEGGEAYPPETEGTLLSRLSLLNEHPPCRADVVLGLTAQSDSHMNSAASPFAHALLVEDSAANTPAISATLIARALAKLFGVPGTTQALVLSDARDGIFDPAAVRTIRAVRNYDFAQGISALSRGTEGHMLSALTDALSGAKPHPEAEAHRILARGFGAALRFDDAVRHLREAVKEDPQNAELRFSFALQLQSDSRPDEAIAQLKTVAEIDPNDAKPHAAMGAILFQARRVDLAVEEFRTATRLDPHDASYQAALGAALSQQPGGIHAASAAFEEAVRLKPAEPGAASGLARQNVAAEALPVTIRQAEAAVSQQPASAAAHLQLGAAHAYAGEVEAARREVQRALQLEPGNGAAHLAMARLDYMSGQYREAAAELDAAHAAGVQPNTDFAEAVRRKLGN